MPQTFFEAGEQGFVVTGFDIDHPVGVKSDLGDCRRKQILARHAPQHLALGSGRNARRKKRRGGAIERSIATTGNFMERAKCHTAPRQVAVDRGNAEGEHHSFARIAAFETRNAISKIGNSSVWRRCTHLSPEREMLMVCSSFVLFLMKSQWHGEVALRRNVWRDRCRVTPIESFADRTMRSKATMPRWTSRRRLPAPKGKTAHKPQSCARPQVRTLSRAGRRKFAPAAGG